MMPGVGISNYISGENGLGVLMKQKKASDTNRRSSHGHESRFLTRFNKIAIQGTPQMAVDKEAICLSRVYSYYPKCNFPLFYV